MRPIIITAIVFNTSWFCMQGIFVALAIDDLGLTEAQVGWTLACYGLGMIAGAAVARRVFARFPSAPPSTLDRSRGSPRW